MSSEDNESKKDEDYIERTSFDQAGASLIEEEDRKRMEQMGDFDSNESVRQCANLWKLPGWVFKFLMCAMLILLFHFQYQDEAIERMRAAIRERTAGLGIEKSKVTADYIAQRERRAREAGPPGAQQDENSFGGLDLTKISQVKQTTSDWDENMPTMFYDPEDDLSKEEQEEVDPIMTKNPIEQGLYELSQSKWPDAFSALREVVLMFVIIGISTLVVTSWDTILRTVYTNFGFIPTAEDIANYASRFDGLDLPDGWTSGMTDVDVQTYSDTLSNSPAASGGGMPEL